MQPLCQCGGAAGVCDPGNQRRLYLVRRDRTARSCRWWSGFWAGSAGARCRFRGRSGQTVPPPAGGRAVGEHIGIFGEDLPGRPVGVQRGGQAVTDRAGALGGHQLGTETHPEVLVDSGRRLGVGAAGRWKSPDDIGAPRSHQRERRSRSAGSIIPARSNARQDAEADGNAHGCAAAATPPPPPRRHLMRTPTRRVTSWITLMILQLTFGAGVNL